MEINENLYIILYTNNGMRQSCQLVLFGTAAHAILPTMFKSLQLTL